VHVDAIAQFMRDIGVLNDLPMCAHECYFRGERPLSSWSMIARQFAMVSQVFATCGCILTPDNVIRLQLKRNNHLNGQHDPLDSVVQAVKELRDEGTLTRPGRRRHRCRRPAGDASRRARQNSATVSSPWAGVGTRRSCHRRIRRVRRPRTRI